MFSQRTSLHASTSRISSTPAVSLNMQRIAYTWHTSVAVLPCQRSVETHRPSQAECPRIKLFTPPSHSMPAPRPTLRPCPQYPPIKAVSHTDVQWGQPLAACSANAHPCPGVNKRACLRPTFMPPLRPTPSSSCPACHFRNILRKHAILLPSPRMQHPLRPPVSASPPQPLHRDAAPSPAPPSGRAVPPRSSSLSAAALASTMSL